MDTLLVLLRNIGDEDSPMGVYFVLPIVNCDKEGLFPTSSPA
jgi:hypothetical protein